MKSILQKFRLLALSAQSTALGSREHPIYRQRPWLVLVTNHPNFPSQVPDHPKAAEYFRRWDLFARGLTFKAPESFALFLTQKQSAPKAHHWRLAIFGKALLLVRRQSWK